MSRLDNLGEILDSYEGRTPHSKYLLGVKVDLNFVKKKFEENNFLDIGFLEGRQEGDIIIVENVHIPASFTDAEGLNIDFESRNAENLIGMVAYCKTDADQNLFANYEFARRKWEKICSDTSKIVLPELVLAVNHKGDYAISRDTQWMTNLNEQTR